MVSRSCCVSIVVPFDGSALSRAAIRRAGQFQSVLDERLVAVTVLKRNVETARENGWLDAEEEFDADRVVAAVHEAVMEITPEADFRRGRAPRQEHGARGGYEHRFRRQRERRPLVTSVSSVGSSVAADDAYDVFIVRYTDPSAGEQPTEEYR